MILFAAANGNGMAALCHPADEVGKGRPPERGAGANLKSDAGIGFAEVQPTLNRWPRQLKTQTVWDLPR